jgi:hypothetical protein
VSGGGVAVTMAPLVRSGPPNAAAAASFLEGFAYSRQGLPPSQQLPSPSQPPMQQHLQPPPASPQASPSKQAGGFRVSIVFRSGSGSHPAPSPPRHPPPFLLQPPRPVSATVPPLAALPLHKTDSQPAAHAAPVSPDATFVADSISSEAEPDTEPDSSPLATATAESRTQSVTLAASSPEAMPVPPYITRCHAVKGRLSEARGPPADGWAVPETPPRAKVQR